MKRTRLAAVVLLVALLVAALWLWRRSSGSEAVDPPVDAPVPAEVEPASRRAPAEPLPGPAAAARRARTDAPSPRRRLSAEARHRLSAALAAARDARVGRPSAAGSGSPPEQAGPGSTDLALRDRTGDDSAWERRQVGVLNELLGGCYDLARAAEPALAGDVTLLFTISAEPDIGGLVEDVHFDEPETSIESAQMRECMQESLVALELDPPPTGVRVSRQITLDLHP